MPAPATQFATPDRFHPADGTGTLIRPVTFEGHLGWLHLPAGPTRRDAGVLLCAPPGRDGRCAYRPLRTLAEHLASAGFPTLRFDLLGVGDSLDPDDDADIWPRWLDGMKAAAGVLKDATGVPRLVAGGVRLGASLAASADIGAEGLILMAPIVSGRQWLEELELAAAAEGFEIVEAEGLCLSAASAAGLAGFDLTRLTATPARALVVAQDIQAAGVAERLASNGCSVEMLDFPGYEALFEDTHGNRPPEVVFARTISWLEDAFPRRALQEVGGLNFSAVHTPVLHPPGAVEHLVHFGPGLSGVLCLPDGAATDGRAALFCNTSGEPRAGVGRFAVTAARTLARRGIASLRFDFAGLGDSEGGDRGHVYETSRQPDFDEALALLASEGFPEVVAVAAGPGAYHAIQALIDDPRIGGVFAIGARLGWRRGEPPGPGSRAPGRTRSVKDAKTWARVLGALTRRLRARIDARLHEAQGRALRAGFADVSERGGRAHLLVGPDDASLDELEIYFGARGRRLADLPGMSVSVQPGLDHGLARAAGREVAMAELLDFVGAD